MATIYTGHQEWHPGELFMHRLMSAPTDSNPNSPYLVPSAAHKVMTSPLLAIGTLDAKNRPWTTLWGGMAGFARPMRIQKGDGDSASAVGMRCLLEGRYDPVLEVLEGRDNVAKGGEVTPGSANGKKVSGLSINFAERTRAKWAGTVLGVIGDWQNGEEGGVKDVQLVAQVDSSLGNCPKYLNKRTIQPFIPEKATQLPSPSDALSEEALSLLASSDCLFITSSNAGTSFSTNYRGGPKGFIRIVPADVFIPPSTPPADLPENLQPKLDSPPETTKIRLCYPEYSGNRLYQTLGNLITTPLAGICIPNFITGDVLYATCTTQILHGKSAAELLPRSNLAVVLTLSSYRLVKSGLGFRAEDNPRGLSPYNPPVRYARGEAGAGALSERVSKKPLATARVVEKEMLGADVARVVFETDTPVKWTPGQAVLISFAGELDTGYEHMRDEDPQSLNDDFIRSFTVSSPAPGDKTDRFEVTVRNVGPCTRLLARANPRAGIELAVLGFGGEFVLSPRSQERKVVFVAGGIGITPLLAQVETLRREGVEVELVWGVRRGDLELVNALLGSHLLVDEKGVSVKVKISGVQESELRDQEKVTLEEIKKKGAGVRFGRVDKDDMDISGASKWFVCAGKGLSLAAEGWAAEKGVEIVQESFAF